VIEVRPTTDADAPLIHQLYSELSDTDLYRRFFSAFRPGETWCQQWAGLGERGGFGVIALLHDANAPAGRPIAEAGYALRKDGDGDLAVTVSADRRGWLGGYLLDVIVDHARRSGLRNLQADVLLENRAMLGLLRHRGAVDLTCDDGVAHLAIATEGFVPSWAPLEERPRLLVETAGGRWAGTAAADRIGVATATCAGPARRRGGCPALAGGPCPLVEGADAVFVARDAGDATAQALIRAHCNRAPTIPVLVRHADRLPPELSDVVVGLDDDEAVIDRFTAIVDADRQT
jgi:GNAT superfamily N-acetyltransferase